MGFADNSASNFGTNVDISAPGVWILSTSFSPSGNDSYRASAGTSYAAPIISGVAALILSQYPEATAEELRGLLLASVDHIDHLNPGFEGKLGTGRVNANKAVRISRTEVILTDTIISNQTISLNRRFFIRENAVLTLNNVVIESCQEGFDSFYGFEIQGSGTLKIISSQVDLGSSFVRVNTPNGRLEITDGSRLTVNGGEFSISDQASLVINNSTVEVANGSSIDISQASVETSNKALVHLRNNSFLSLRNSSLITESGTHIFLEGLSYIMLHESSRWDAVSSRIIGFDHNATFVEPDLDEYDFVFDDTYLEDALMGDAGFYQRGIYVDASIINFASTVSSHDMAPSIFGLDEIFIRNSKPDFQNSYERNILTTNVLGVNFIRIHNSVLDFIDARLSGMGNIILTNMSGVVFDNTCIENINELLGIGNSSLTIKNNSVYKNNQKGVYLIQGSISIADSELIGNGNYALKLDIPISWNPGNSGETGLVLNSLKNVSIRGNLGDAISLFNTTIGLIDVTIEDNQGNAFSCMSANSSRIVGNVYINNNTGSAEILASGLGFPRFLPCPTTGQKPTIGFDLFGILPSDRYFLQAAGDFMPPIDVRNLIIESSNQDDMFYPDRSSFRFDTPVYDELDDMLNMGYRHFDAEEYIQAFEHFIDLVEMYPESSQAVRSIPELPHVYIGLDWSLYVLIEYLASIEDANLIKIARNTIVYIYMILEEYQNAIDLLDVIINDKYTNDFERLNAMLLQSFAHLQLQQGDSRGISTIAVYQPNSFKEYRELSEDIMNKIQNLIDGTYDPDNETVPVPLTNSLKANYPNPFNPSTTISFDIAKESHVKIDVFNIRGQKVKTLTNELFGAGTHMIEWYGDDDAERNVASGIYFYRMQTDEFTQTRRMVLLK